MAAQDVSENPRAVDRSGERGGSIGLVLAVALLLVGSVIALLFIGRANAQPYILTLLSALAVIGVFSLFAGAAGLLRLSRRAARAPAPVRRAGARAPRSLMRWRRRLRTGSSSLTRTAGSFTPIPPISNWWMPSMPTTSVPSSARSSAIRRCRRQSTASPRQRARAGLSRKR